MKLFLSSLDCEEFSIPLEIIDYEKVLISNRNCLIIKTSNELPFSNEYKDKVLNKFVLVGRYSDESIANLSKFPISVHVLEYLEGDIELKDRYNFAWAFLYDNEKDAQEGYLPNNGKIY